tara:strand:+ start:1400 stop:1849 length:450 start_codon:yes stop_codon:yes gene_type:complete
MSVIINCPLCGEKSLHINTVSENSDVRQCINCGYSTNTNLKGNIKENEVFQNFSEFIKKFSKEASNHIWFPSMINLPIGSLYPVEEDNQLKWALVRMIDIPEDKQKNYPDEMNPGKFLTKTLDYENQEVFDEYIFALAKFRDEVKNLNG